jgi:hypothetical protein
MQQVLLLLQALSLQVGLFLCCAATGTGVPAQATSTPHEWDSTSRGGGSRLGLAPTTSTGRAFKTVAQHCDVALSHATLSQAVRGTKDDFESMRGSLSQLWKAQILSPFEKGCRFVRLKRASRNAAVEQATGAVSSSSAVGQGRAPSSSERRRRLRADVAANPFTHHPANQVAASASSQGTESDDKSARAASASGNPSPDQSGNAGLHAAIAARIAGARTEAEAVAAAAEAAAVAKGGACFALEGDLGVNQTLFGPAHSSMAARELASAESAAREDLATPPFAASSPRIAVAFTLDRASAVEGQLERFSVHLSTHVHHALFSGFDYDVLLYARREEVEWPAHVPPYFVKALTAHGALFGAGYGYVLAVDWDSWIDPLSLALLPALAAAWPNAAVMFQAEPNLCACAL